MSNQALRVPERASARKHNGRPNLATTVINRSVEQLKAFPDNPREHSDKQIEKLMHSIEGVGFTDPILIDEDGMILSGHGRWEAVKRLGWTSIPTLTHFGCTQAQKRTIVLAENRLSELSLWNNARLKGHLETLLEIDYDIELTGFSASQVDIIIDSPADAAALGPEDELPNVAARAVSRQGDLWELGNHRLLCGDSRNTASYRTLMGTTSAQMVLSDAPYNVKIHGHARGRGKVHHREFAMASGEMSNAEFEVFLTEAMASAGGASRNGSLHFWFIDWRHLPTLLKAGERTYDEWKQLLVWNKVNGGQGAFYRSQHELIAVFKKGSAPHVNNFGLGSTGRFRTNVIDYPGMVAAAARNHKERDLHPTVKPVGLLADLMRDCSSRGGLILDPFAGSGSAILAAERAGRLARAIEIDPLYVDVAIRRWQDMTKKKAILSGTSQTFAQLSKERTGRPSLFRNVKG